MSERTEALMVNTPIKAQQVALEELTDEMRATRPGFEWKLDLERARLLTESYKQTENEPMTVRRAKALAHILDNMTIYIRSDEMIVGNYARDKDSVPFYPEFAWKWIVRDTAPGQVYSGMLTDEGREELKEICDYWGNSSLHHRLRKYLPDELKEVFWIFNWESSTPNYEKILRVGLKGILEEVQQRKEELEEDYIAETMTGIDYVRKRDELDAMALSLEASIRWAKRYAAMAREKAEKTLDPSRKEELETIADTCEWVPENPARTFHEALQSYWLIHLIINFLEIPMVGTGIRFDQVMNRFYEKDVEEGRIDRDQAQELVEFLIVKFQETGFLARTALVRVWWRHPGVPDGDARRCGFAGQGHHERDELHLSGCGEDREGDRPSPRAALARRHARGTHQEGDRGPCLRDAPAGDLQRQGEPAATGRAGMLDRGRQGVFDQQLHGAHDSGQELQSHLGLGGRCAPSHVPECGSRHPGPDSLLQECGAEQDRPGDDHPPWMHCSTPRWRTTSG